MGDRVVVVVVLYLYPVDGLVLPSIIHISASTNLRISYFPDTRHISLMPIFKYG